MENDILYVQVVIGGRIRCYNMYPGDVVDSVVECVSEEFGLDKRHTILLRFPDPQTVVDIKPEDKIEDHFADSCLWALNSTEGLSEILAQQEDAQLLEEGALYVRVVMGSKVIRYRMKVGEQVRHILNRISDESGFDFKETALIRFPDPQTAVVMDVGDNITNHLDDSCLWVLNQKRDSGNITSDSM